MLPRESLGVSRGSMGVAAGQYRGNDVGVGVVGGRGSADGR